MFEKPRSNYRNLKLSQKFTLLLSVVFLVGIALSGAALSAVLNYNAQNQIASEASALLETMNSVRVYTTTQVNPQLVDRLETEFLPQSVPSYSVREVSEILRANPRYSEYFYKEATLNPTNLRDKADSFETEIVERFRQDPNLKDLRGFRDASWSNLFYIARPIAVAKPKCLDCHSTPENAPKSMLERYGTTHGFGWELNEIVAAQVIYIPARKVFQKFHQSLVFVLGIVVVVFAAAIFIVNRWLKRYILRPLTQMTQVAEAVSMGDLEAEFVPRSQDEVGTLAEAFTRMKTSLAMAMRKLEQYRNS